MTEPATRARAAYDPFAAPTPAFPRARLERAGLDDELVDNLAGRWDAMSARQRRNMAAFVTRHPDSVIAARYTEPEAETPEQVRERLEGKTGEELRDLLRAQNKPTRGRNAELIDRLLADNVVAEGSETPDDGAQPPAEPPAEDPATTETPDAPADAQGDAEGDDEQPSVIVGDGDAPQPVTPAPEPAAPVDGAPAGTDTPGGDNVTGQPTNEEQ